MNRAILDAKNGWTSRANITFYPAGSMNLDPPLSEIEIFDHLRNADMDELRRNTREIIRQRLPPSSFRAMRGENYTLRQSSANESNQDYNDARDDEFNVSEFEVLDCILMLDSLLRIN